MLCHTSNNTLQLIFFNFMEDNDIHIKMSKVSKFDEIHK
jgi:hypothetical protein